MVTVHVRQVASAESEYELHECIQVSYHRRDSPHQANSAVSHIRTELIEACNCLAVHHHDQLCKQESNC